MEAVSRGLRSRVYFSLGGFNRPCRSHHFLLSGLIAFIYRMFPHLVSPFDPLMVSFILLEVKLVQVIKINPRALHQYKK